MNNPHSPRHLALIALSVSIAGIALARGGPPGYEIPWSSIDGGGGTAAGGAYALTGTIGQPEAGATLGGGAYQLAGGFWHGGTIVSNCPANVVITGSSASDVDVDDLLAVITGWGACANPCPPHCAPDVAPAGPPTGNCIVNVDDLLAVIVQWGPCP